MAKKDSFILLVASGLIHLISGSGVDAENDSVYEDISFSNKTLSWESYPIDPFPAWRLMWNLLGIHLFLIFLVYAIISVLEKFYLEKRGFYDFEMEDWRMD